MTETKVPAIARAVAAVTNNKRIAELKHVRAVRERHLRSALSQPSRPGHSGNQRVAVVLNPIKDGAKRTRRELTEACEELGWEVPQFFETTAEDPGVQMARDALAIEPDVVIAGGGDGTIRLVAHVLQETDVPIALIPLGTGNLLARNLEIDPDDLSGNVDAALHGHERLIDTSTIRLTREDGSVEEQTGLVMAGIGFDAEVIAGTRDDLKDKISWLAYGEAGVRKLIGRRQPVTMDLDERDERQFRMRSVLVANCGLLPGGIDFIPDAVIDDGNLNVVIMAPRNALEWFAVLGKVLFKQRRSLPAIRYYQTRHASVSTEKPTMTQVDGDGTGDAVQLEVTVNHAALTVRVLPPQLIDHLSEPVPTTPAR